MRRQQEYGLCNQCGQYHWNPIRQTNGEFNRDVAALIENSDQLEQENGELSATLEIMERELYDARQQIEVLRLRLQVIQLENENLRLRETWKPAQSNWEPQWATGTSSTGTPMPHSTTTVSCGEMSMGTLNEYTNDFKGCCEDE